MAEQTIRGYPLSRQQKRLWQFLQYETAFAVQAALLLTGRLDRERLRQSFARMVDRHEILRTTFRQPSGLTLPIQVVGDEAEPIWKEIDVPLGEAPLLDVVETLLQRDRQPLRVADHSLLGCTLGVVDGSRHLLLITASPLVADLESLYLAAEDAMRDFMVSVGGAGDLPEHPLLEKRDGVPDFRNPARSGRHAQSTHYAAGTRPFTSPRSHISPAMSRIPSRAVGISRCSFGACWLHDA